MTWQSVTTRKHQQQRDLFIFLRRLNASSSYHLEHERPPILQPLPLLATPPHRIPRPPQQKMAYETQEARHPEKQGDRRTLTDKGRKDNKENNSDGSAEERKIELRNSLPPTDRRVH